MLIIDNSETRENAQTFFHLKKYIDINDTNKIIKCSNLEELTGCDLMITPSKLLANSKINENILKFHLSKFAVLVQIKHGNDFIKSIYDKRINNFEYKIQKLREAGANIPPCQVLLLYVGQISAKKDKLTINREIKNISSRAFLGKIIALRQRGITFDIVSDNQLFNKLSLEESAIESLPKIKDFVPPQLEVPPINLLQRIEDFRIPLTSIPGFGIKAVNELGQWMENQNIPLNLKNAITALCGDAPYQIKGWGKAKKRNFLQWYYGINWEKLTKKNSDGYIIHKNFNDLVLELDYLKSIRDTIDKLPNDVMAKLNMPFGDNDIKGIEDESVNTE